MGSRVEGLGIRVWGLRFGVWGLRFGVQDYLGLKELQELGVSLAGLGRCTYGVCIHT